MSVGELLKRNNGIGPGFDTIRLVFSIAVLALHSILVCYGYDFAIATGYTPLGPIAGSGLPMFFALSGFLVTGSALRTSDLRKFITLRALRIVPALATEITLSAIVLGLLLTTYTARQYFSSHEFIEYFGALIGRVKLQLPGVFETNPYPGIVNVSLWTISPELLCYVFMSVLITANIYRQKILITTVTVILAALYAVRSYTESAQLIVEGAPDPALLLLSFAYGSSLYYWRDKVPYNGALFAFCLVFGLSLIRIHGADGIAAAALTYCVVFLGMTPLPKIPILSRGDYSYGIYLYAFPIQQSLAQAFPETREWYLNTAIALPFAVAMAMLSWRFVERPALSLRGPLGATSRTPPKERTFTWTVLIFFGLFSYGLLLSRNAGLLYWELNLENTLFTVIGVAALAVLAAALTFGGTLLPMLKPKAGAIH